MQITTTLVSHNPKSIQGRNGLFTIHEFTDANGLEFSTTKTPIANQLYSLLNTPVGLEYEEKVNGNFTNRHIQKVLGGAAVPEAVAAAPAAPTAAPTAPTSGPTTQAPAAKPQLFSQDEKQVLIMFQSFGNGAALELTKNLEEVSVEAWATVTKAMIVEALKFSKDAVASVTAGGASSPGTGGGDAGAGKAPAPAQTDDGIPF